MTHRTATALAMAFAAALFIAPAASAEEAPAIAAAADLQFALTEIADAFREETGRDVRLTFGSSGNFFRQIREGAPFQAYFSADEKYVIDLAASGHAEDEGAIYAIGRIVMMVPHGSPVAADENLADLRAALADGRLRKFAIANPEHAPYGRRAQEALRHAGLWDSIGDKLVFGENVSQAAQFATAGDAQGGIIAYSLALAPNVARLGSYALIPESWHEPLRQRVAVLTGAGDTARRFVEFVRSNAARLVMKHYGFVLPGDTM
jgi:molybdate transport system substrate-binding protein